MCVGYIEEVDPRTVMKEHSQSTCITADYLIMTHVFGSPDPS